MVDCEFYESFPVSVTRNPIGAGRNQGQTNVSDVFFCNHKKHSPVTMRNAKNTIGKLLKCGGERCRCPLSKEQIDDVD